MCQKGMTLRERDSKDIDLQELLNKGRLCRTVGVFQALSRRIKADSTRDWKESIGLNPRSQSESSIPWRSNSISVQSEMDNGFAAMMKSEKAYEYYDLLLAVCLTALWVGHRKDMNKSQVDTF